MKKQFFYAALAIGMMSSCTSSDLPGNQAPEEQLPEEERVAIELGISSPNAKIEASTKGIGSVGGIDEEENKWKGEELGIWMYKVTDDNAWAPAVEEDGTTPILDGVTKFKAPYESEETKSGKIHMIKSVGATEDQNVYVAKYYPSTGRYSFYGFHLDDAPANPNQTSHTITDIEIDGTQDIMAAVAKEVNSANYPTATAPVGGEENIDWDTAPSKSFSAWSARRKIQPILNFEHKLARLRFFVKAGEASAAAKEWINTDPKQWKDRAPVTAKDKTGQDVPNASTAVTITSIEVLGLDNKLQLVFDKDGEQNDIATVTALEGTNNFKLMGPTNTTGRLDALTPQAPLYWSQLTEMEGKTDAERADDYKPTTQVGESIMFFPNGTSKTELNIKIGVQQAVVDEYKINSSGQEVDKTYILKDDVLETTLLSSKIGSEKKFTAGESYDIIITVYSYQRIEISAELTAWTNGGSINTAPGDEF